MIAVRPSRWVVLLAVTVLPGAAAAAAAQEAAAPKLPIIINSVSPQKKKDGWYLRVVGKAPELPAGTVIDFVVRWLSKDVDAFTVTLDGSRQIREKFLARKITGPIENLHLRAYIHFAKQPESVRKKLEGNPTRFPMKQNPWTYVFMDQGFKVGTEAQLKKQREEIREFFKASLIVLERIESSFTEAHDQAQEKTRFVKNEQFNADAWQQWQEKEVREPLRRIQAKIRASKNNVVFLPFKRDLGYLGDIGCCVAKRSVERSKALYREQGLSPDPKDLAPKDLDLNAKRQTVKHLRQRAELLMESQGIDLEEKG